MPGIVGGVIGAVLAVFGAPYVQGPPPLAPEAASRLAAVESSTTAQSEQLAALQTLAEELEPTVQSAVEAAVAEVPSQDAAALAALDERLGAVTGEVSALAEAAAAAVDPQPLLEEQGERLSALQTALEALEGRIATEAGRVDALTADVATRVDALTADVATRVDALTADVTAGLESAREAASAEVTEARDAGSAEVRDAQAALSGEIAALRSELETALGEISTARQSIEDLQQARGRAAAAALLVREIDQSIAEGGGFEEPLERLTAMSGEEAELEAALATLRPYAAEGVPTIGELRADLAALAETRPTPSVAGYQWLGETVDNITGLVRVRDKDSESDIATGRLAEADQALRDGDVEAAIADVEAAASQPDGVDPEAAETWLEDARARAAAVAAQAQLEAHIRDILTATVN